MCDATERRPPGSAANQPGLGRKPAKKLQSEGIRTMTNASRKHVGLRATGAVSVWLAIALAATAAWGQSRCTSDKYKAAGKYSLALAVCHAKAVAGGIPIDPACE